MINACPNKNNHNAYSSNPLYRIRLFAISIIIDFVFLNLNFATHNYWNISIVNINTHGFHSLAKVVFYKLIYIVWWFAFCRYTQSELGPNIISNDNNA